jgi:hypothetical protein
MLEALQAMAVLRTLEKQLLEKRATNNFFIPRDGIKVDIDSGSEVFETLYHSDKCECQHDL